MIESFTKLNRNERRLLESTVILANMMGYSTKPTDTEGILFFNPTTKKTISFFKADNTTNHCLLAIQEPEKSYEVVGLDEKIKLKKLIKRLQDEL